MVTWDGDIPRNAGSGQAAGGRRTLRHCCGRGQAPRPLNSRTGAGNTEAGNPSRGQRSLEAPDVRIKVAQNTDPGLAETASRLRRKSRIDEDSGDVGAPAPAGRAAAAHWGPPGAQMDQSEAGTEELAAMSALMSSQHLSRLRVHLPSLAHYTKVMIGLLFITFNSRFVLASFFSEEIFELSSLTRL